ncbi:MAG TPA: TolC family protein, partial [Bacteroidales bacterium]|nr:TolC family protein [Bacteroidales bacterium]
MESTKVNNFRFLFLLLPGILFLQPAPAQDTLRLEECYRLAEKNYPLVLQSGLLDQASTLRIQNLGKNFLPQFTVNGSASYQSAVTSINLDLPKGFPAIDFPSPKKDMYKVTLDVNQSIYDGRATRRQQELETTGLRADTKSAEVEMYKLRDRVNQLYFTLLLLDRNEQLLRSNRERVEAKLAEIRSGISNGSVPAMNADLLLVERVRLDQQLDETAKLVSTQELTVT